MIPHGIELLCWLLTTSVQKTRAGKSFFETEIEGFLVQPVEKIAPFFTRREGNGNGS
jgi:hypothetical protein